MFKSIRARMTAAYSLSVALLMVIASAGLVSYARQSAEKSAASLLHSASFKLKSELSEHMDDRNILELIEDEQEELKLDKLSLFLMSNDGRILRSSSTRLPDSAPEDGKQWRTTRLSAGNNWLVIALPWEDTEASLQSLTKILALMGLFVVALATVGSWILIGRTLSPIGQLSHQADAATVENLNVHLNEPSQDSEIVGLVATLNRLLSRLSDAASAKGRFYSAASHELRTPLQALSGHLELALNKDRTKEEYITAVKEAYHQTKRLIKLTQNLLLLYQIDSSTIPLLEESVDLAAVCKDALAQLQPVISERRLRIHADIPESVPLTALETHSEIMVRNLLENAVQYANPGTEVKLDLKAFSDHLELVIANECSLSHKIDSNRLFEPFARLDKSRNLQTGGTGLGLTICKAIADLNRWTLTLESDSSTFYATLTIPADR